MSEDVFRDVIAERTYDLRLGERVAPVLVQLGRPVPRADGVFCGIRICVAGGQVVEHVAVSFDAFDALRLALQMLRHELLDEVPRRTGGRVLFSEQDAARFLPHQFLDAPDDPPGSQSAA
jgi:hypothetical protein